MMNQYQIDNINNRFERIEIVLQQLIKKNNDKIIEPNVTITFNNGCRCSKCHSLIIPSHDKYNILYKNGITILTCSLCFI